MQNACHEGGPQGPAFSLHRISQQPPPPMTSLNQIAESIVADNKGILAADESTPTIGMRFAGIDVENLEDNRRTYRGMLFTTDGAEEYIGGVILYDETLRQSLKAAGCLTRDARQKERKKYGQKGARARFQFSKR